MSSTNHQFIVGDARRLNRIPAQSVHLVVTSPPYPMIKMWDDIFSKQNPEIEKALVEGQANLAFELMHQTLDAVWTEVDRTLLAGGVCCINIGDATRTVDKQFALYPNHQRIQQKFISLGYQCLPNIIWRKITNAPNKFMGSGMMPSNAYVTLEHEWILLFRKNGRRRFESDVEKLNRRASAFFWEERNEWFSDLWQLPGTSQQLNSLSARARSGAFPFTLPYRIVNMYSVKGDTILDPFVGTGTTQFAALAAERNSIGIELDANLQKSFFKQVSTDRAIVLNQQIANRLADHSKFVQTCNKPLKHMNLNHNTKVFTRQEMDLQLRFIESIQISDDALTVCYNDQEPLIPKVF